MCCDMRYAWDVEFQLSSVVSFYFYKKISLKTNGQITTYPSVVCLKFKLPTSGLKFDNLPT